MNLFISHPSEELKLGELHDNIIRDVAWAPCMGRSYHLIATADSSNIFKIADSRHAPKMARP